MQNQDQPTRKTVYILRHKESGKYWATCGMSKYPTRAYTFDSVEQAMVEVTWNVQHGSEEFATGTWEAVEV
jgi:hypothetical protein